LKVPGPGPDPAGSNVATFPNAPSNGFANAPGFNQPFSLTQSQISFNAFRVFGQVTSLLSHVSTTALEPLSSDVRIRITTPNNTTFTLAPVIPGTNSFSTTSIDITTPYLGPQAGDWNIALFEAALNAVGFDNPLGVDNLWNNISIQLVTIPPPSSAINIGSFQGRSTSTPEALISIRPTAPTALQWFTFSTSQLLSSSTGYYVDIDTSRTTLNGNIVDTILALYSSRGEVLGIDDDSGPGSWSMLTFGATFERFGIDPIPPATTAGAPRDGIDGPLPPGTYYVAHADFRGTFGPVFTVTPSANPAVRQLNLRTNLTDIARISPCGAADLGSQGGAEGFDRLLDNNDFIVFIQLFFAGNARADLGAEGGAPGPDTLFDNNDFIVFIQEFFAGASNSGCNGNP
jgi:hypothetical protein